MVSQTTVRGSTEMLVKPRQVLMINLLGTFEVRLGDTAVVLANRKCRALLSLLALADKGRETRDRLVGMLWSESEQERAHASLRQALYQLRAALKAAGNEDLIAEKLDAAIDPKSITVDVLQILAEAKAGRPHPLLLQDGGGFDTMLADLETVDPAFRTWLLAKRQTLHERVSSLLADALRNPARSAPGREELARALAKLDPTNEEAARVLIRARVAAGDIGGALGLYKMLWDLLDADYDVEPTKETQALIAAVKLGDLLPHEADVVTRSTVRQSTEATDSGSAQLILGGEQAKRPHVAPKLVLAIGMFDGRGARPDKAYLIHGFRRELIASLVRFREWIVREAAPAGQSIANPYAGSEYIVEASAVDVKQDIRLVLTLKDAVTQDYVWTDRLMLTIEDWTAAQLSVIQRIATALNVYLSSSRISNATYQADHDLKAYDAWLYAQSRILTWTPATHREATELLQSIITTAPSFAPAYSSLAQMHNSSHFAHPGLFRSAQRTEEALRLGREATRLDPVDSRGHLSLGWAHAMARQHDLAETHHGLAQELNENDPWTAMSAALGYATRGQFPEAKKLADRILEFGVNPTPSHWGYHEQIRFMSGDYQGCLEAAGPAGTTIATSPSWMLAALGRLRRSKQAESELAKYISDIRMRWLGEIPATEENIARWTMHCFPFRRLEDFKHFQEGLAAAGLPVSGLMLDKW
jgi:DNA-binding SARP family transcriptional activator/TolB-like protein